MGTERSTTELVTHGAEPLGALDEPQLGGIVGRAAGSRLVLIGEASHGTSEFYAIRASITRSLIERGAIRFVAIEADWPDAARLDAYVRDIEHTGRSVEFQAFARFPSWMWRNEVVLRFVDWLREWNSSLAPDRRVGIHGLDLYSLNDSIEMVIAYLDDVDPAAASLARERYGCLTPFRTDPATYGYAALSADYLACGEGVVAMLREMLDRRLEYEARGRFRFLDAAANARLVADAERYYRSMFESDEQSWNLRDTHMFEMLVRILDVYGPGSAGAVWAHNSHLGDASATAMASRGELNVGQLVREQFGEDAYAVGFGTHEGTVTAAASWGGRPRTMTMRPSNANSYERLFHDAGLDAASIPLREDAADGALREALLEPRLERAIGVIYRPQTELVSHYFRAVLPRQFDELVFLDRTTAVVPLGGGGRGPLPAGHPFATVDA
jgi:erythromycin esterase-like protein